MTDVGLLARRILKRSPRIKAFLKHIIYWRHLRNGVSVNYVQLNEGQRATEFMRLKSAWQSEDLPGRQRALVEQELAAYRRGESVGVFDVLVRTIRMLPSDVRGMSALEVGCASGFYSEVFDIAGVGVTYTGCDYSDAFIAMAQRKYPALRFDVEDATSLTYADSSFDIVISGCCLLHIADYQAAVAETARVARGYAIFHRTPVVLGQPNVYYRKHAYGVETVEIHFNEPDFLLLLARQGLKLLATYTLNETILGEVGSANRTYVCEKIHV